MRSSTDASLWVTEGGGRKVVEWFEAAKLQEPAILGPAHPCRSRIDNVIGQPNFSEGRLCSENCR